MAHHDPRQQVAAPPIKAARRSIPGGVIAGVAALALTGLTAALAGGWWTSFLFWGALCWFVSPGLVLAGRWFTGLERALVGSLLGFFFSSLGASAVVALGGFGPALWGVPAVGLAVVWATGKLIGTGDSEALRVDETDETDDAPAGDERRWAVAAAAVAVGLVAWPFMRVGAEIERAVAFRAYFSADLMTHLAVVAEIQKGSFPLTDPFFAGAESGRLAYYWLFFVFPASLAQMVEGMTNQQAMLATNLAGCILFSLLLYRMIRRLGAAPRRAWLIFILGVMMVSFEGVVAAAAQIVAGDSLRELANLNVDAVGRWIFELSSIDGLHRSLLYTPQHLFSYSCLIVLMMLVERGEPTTLSMSLLAGSLLGAMAGTSIVSAMIAGPWLMLVIGRRLLTGRLSPGRTLLCSLGIGATSLACLAWFGWLGFFGGASSSLIVRVPSLLELPVWLLLDLGILSLILGWSTARAIAGPRPTLSPMAWELALLAALAIGCALGLDLRGYEGVWMVWRAGSVLTIAMIGGVAICLRNGRLPRWLWPLLAAASLTVALDVYNAQDIHNRSMSAGEFPWTSVISREEWNALRWIRNESPADAVVQWDVRARGAGQWAHIPALGERRMAVGFPIFLLETRKYRARERRLVRPIFTSADVALAHELAVSVGIDFVVVGRTELRVRSDRLRVLWEDADRFRVVFTEGETTIFRVVT